MTAKEAQEIAKTLPLFEDAVDTSGEHWYCRDGSPAYRVLRAKPKKLDDGTWDFYKDTTLREAKKYKLLRSVTTFLDRLASPGLESWRTGQLLEAAYNIPNNYDFPDSPDAKTWKAEVLEEATRVAREARETGTLIHGAVEKRLTAQDSDPQWDAHVDSALAALNKLAPGGWESERVVVGGGYAGKVDAINQQAGIVVDFKTQKAWGKKGPTIYPEWAMQGAAYCKAAGVLRFASIVIAREDGTQVFVKEWEPLELENAWNKFDLVRRLVTLETGL